MRYGLGNRVDGSFNAGPTSLGVHADFAVVARDSFNLSTGLGFGLVGAKLSSTGIVSDELDLSIEDLPGGGGIGIGPDFNVKASFGSLENEGTVGLRVAYFGGGAGSSTSSGTVSGTNTSGGSLMGGPVFSFTHRGDRLIITPEIDVLFGKSMIQAQQDLGLTGFAAFIVPSVTFAMVK